MTDRKLPEQRDEQAEQAGFQKLLGHIRVQLVLVLVAAALFAFVLGVALNWYINPQDSSEKKDLVQALGLILAGLAGAVGIYFTWRGQRLTQKGLQDTLRITREGQITERFTRAIDQLGATDDEGNPRLEIRLGGIYALERIDKESPERAYHSTVMEVLTAYVRENAPWPPKSPSEDFIRPPGRTVVSDSASDETVEQKEGTEQGTQPAPNTPRDFMQPMMDAQAILNRRKEDRSTLPTDIQALLEIFKRRDEDKVPKKHRTLLNLRRTDLRGANLDKAHLVRADLSGAHLVRADLREAHLHRADLTGAHLDIADLNGAHLEGADLREAHLAEAILINAHLHRATLEEAHLEGAFLNGARLRRANLYEARLERAHLSGVHLERATLSEAHLERATLSGAHLENASLYGAHLEGAHFFEAHLEKAAFHRAYLEGADLRGAHLEGAFLNGAYLEGADLSGAHLEGAFLNNAHLERARGLTSEQIERTIGNENTELPKYLVDPPPHSWNSSIEQQIEILRGLLERESKDE